ncbi:LysE family translocator [Halomonas sp. GXIMD04776]|uniref:LysE family translocator n=1 Tax=Halomonas sp. GXIMD04776 TaxID=3415605 RepID=UPI003C9BE56E
MIDLGYWSVFLGAAIVLNISPGPDLIYILSRTIANGRRIGIASSLGVCSGAFVHVVAAAAGISAILMTSAVAFMVVKYIGGAYLIYLGIQALRSSGASFDAARVSKKPVTAWRAYKQGVMIDVLNPKVAIFFMAFLPQFVRADAGPVALQLILLGLAVNIIAVIIECSIVLLAARTTTFFRNSSRLSKWLDRVLGTVLVALGVRLALSERVAT